MSAGPRLAGLRFLPLCASTNAFIPSSQNTSPLSRLWLSFHEAGPFGADSLTAQQWHSVPSLDDAMGSNGAVQPLRADDVVSTSAAAGAFCNPQLSASPLLPSVGGARTRPAAGVGAPPGSVLPQGPAANPGSDLSSSSSLAPQSYGTSVHRHGTVISCTAAAATAAAPAPAPSVTIAVGAGGFAASSHSLLPVNAAAAAAVAVAGAAVGDPRRTATSAAATVTVSAGPPPQRRQLSVQPEAAVYAGPSQRAPSRVTLRTIRRKYEAGEPLTMVTAYDYPSAVHVEEAGIDILLVGDSVAMVVHGHDTTLPIRMDDMIAHCKAVARGARRAFLVGDLPFGCYETDARDAVRSAVRMLKEGGMDAVKLEGGSPARVEAARAIVETGVAVMGHVGLTPQSISAIGGFRPQAQVADEALRVLDQALALQAAGCFALVLECIPGPIAAAITRALAVPTIGIGAGGECSGQVLVYHDLLGMMSHPHHAKVTPKFCKQYARVGDIIGAALQQYRREVEDRSFPGTMYSPYAIPEHEVELLAEALRQRGLQSSAQAVLDETHRAAQDKKAAAAGGGGGGEGGAAGAGAGAGAESKQS